TRIASQKNPASAASQRTPCASFMCMKKSTTSVAFTPAMPNASGVLNGPRSTYETRIVSAVRKRSAASTNPYVRGPCSSLAGTDITPPPTRLRSRRVPSDQVQDRPQEDPDDVDEMPVERSEER